MTTTTPGPAGPEPARPEQATSGPERPAAATVRFGPADSNVLLRSTGDKVLALLFERHRDIFGALVGEAVTGEAVAVARRRHRPAGNGDQ